MKRVIIFLLLGALVIAVMACSPGGGGFFGGYSITISSTIGGTVATPGEGLFSYPGGTVVNLVAEPDRGYHFVCWYTNANTIADVYAAATTVTIDNYYFITAGFAAD